MALPILWLGAVAISALAVKSLNEDRKRQQKHRKTSYKPKTLSRLKPHQSPIAIYPSDILLCQQKVKPEIGAIVCCGIGGILDHTGIWIGDDMIVELDGNGLIKAISSQRFITERSGKQIFIACDSMARPLVNRAAAKRACEQIFQYREYHVINNNCHCFIWQCFASEDKPLSTFKELNCRLADYFDRVIYWDLANID